jgi:hypothetical protein
VNLGQFSSFLEDLLWVSFAPRGFGVVAWFLARGFSLVASFSHGFGLVASAGMRACADGYGWWASFSHGNNKFMWVVKGLHPRRIPTSEARGGASVAVNNVKHWLRMMDNTIKAVGYDLYTDDETRYVRFKSPFDRRPLVGPRPRFRYVAVLALLDGCSSLLLLLVWLLIPHVKLNSRRRVR